MSAAVAVVCSFPPSALPQNVTTVTVFDIDYKSAGSRSVALQLSNILLTLPLSFQGYVLGGMQLADLRSIDLPLLGNVAVSGKDVTALPYVGMVDAISNLYASNANIQQTSGGFVVRGSVSGSYMCVYYWSVRMGQGPGGIWVGGGEQHARQS